MYDVKLPSPLLRDVTLPLFSVTDVSGRLVNSFLKIYCLTLEYGTRQVVPKRPWLTIKQRRLISQKREDRRWNTTWTSSVVKYFKTWSWPIRSQQSKTVLKRLRKTFNAARYAPRIKQRINDTVVPSFISFYSGTVHTRTCKVFFLRRRTCLIAQVAKLFYCLHVTFPINMVYCVQHNKANTLRAISW